MQSGVSSGIWFVWHGNCHDATYCIPYTDTCLVKARNPDRLRAASCQPVVKTQELLPWRQEPLPNNPTREHAQAGRNPSRDHVQQEIQILSGATDLERGHTSKFPTFQCHPSHLSISIRIRIYIYIYIIYIYILIYQADLQWFTNHLGGFGICWSGDSYPNHRWRRWGHLGPAGSLTKSVARLDHRKAAPWTQKVRFDMEVWLV